MVVDTENSVPEMNGHGRRSAGHSTALFDNCPNMHDALLRNANRESKRIEVDPFLKYDIVDVIGRGSMGAVTKVSLKPSHLQGEESHPDSKPQKARGRFTFSHLFGKSKKKHEDNTHYYALKSIIYDRISSQLMKEFRNEVNILRGMDHPNIVKAHEVYECSGQMFLVLELCSGGDLYTQSPYSLERATHITRQIVSAISYMHDHGVVHRDLKFENVCFENKDPHANVKVIDFGLSKKFKSGKPGMMTQRVGTMYTISPQVLEGLYSSEADMWSLGVMAYMLLSSTQPFDAKTRKDMAHQISSGKYRPMTNKHWRHVPEEAKDFIKNTIEINPRIRMTAHEAIEHPWLFGVEQYHARAGRQSHILLSGDDDEHAEEAVNSFERYKNTSELKKLGLMVIAHHSTHQDILELRDAFKKYDEDRDGVLSFAEFKKGLRDIGRFDDEKIHEIFDSIDVSHVGAITYTEFLAATIESHGCIQEDRIAEAFDRLDSEHTGFITRKNLEKIIGHDLTEEEYHDVVGDMDEKGDGKINYTEFLHAFRSNYHRKTEEMLRLHEGEHDAEKHE